MIAIGYLCQGALGNRGPSSGGWPVRRPPYRMTINIGPGAIASLRQWTARRSIADIRHQSAGQARINEGSTSFTLTGLPRRAVDHYLIEATFLERTALRSSCPIQRPAIIGRNLSWGSIGQRTAQKPSGCSSAPATQSGRGCNDRQRTNDDLWWTALGGLYVITVNYGQTAVTTNEIAGYSPSSMLPASLGKSCCRRAACLTRRRPSPRRGGCRLCWHLWAGPGFSEGGSTSIVLPPPGAGAGTVGSSG